MKRIGGMMLRRVAGMIAVVACLGVPAHAVEHRSPRAVAVSPDGRTLYVSDRTALCVAMLDAAAGKKVREVAITGEPNGLALSADGKTLYVTANNSHRVVAFDRKGKATGGWGGDGNKAGEFKYPGTIALDASGNVVVADIMNARVQVFDPAGAPTAEIGGLGANPGNFLRPKGVAVAPDGRIFVSDSYFGLVQVCGADGAFAGVLAVGGEPVKFEAPTGLAFAGNRLFVTDMLAGKVLAFDVEGGQ
jgi:DNA-binding beta-propeller fold protein YncE